MPEPKPKFVRWLSPTELEDHPDHPENLIDHRRGWVDVTHTETAAGTWGLITETEIGELKCRHSTKTPCPRRPVVILWRSRGYGHRAHLVRWAYCELHMYGRILEDGRILESRLLERSEFPGGAS